MEIFSRDLRRITDQFNELAEQGQKFETELILDGEIMAFEQGKKLTFFDLQKRLGRKSEGTDLFATVSADVPVAFVAFDLLWKNGKSFLRRRCVNAANLRGLNSRRISSQRYTPPIRRMRSKGIPTVAPAPE